MLQLPDSFSILQAPQAGLVALDDECRLQRYFSERRLVIWRASYALSFGCALLLSKRRAHRDKPTMRKTMGRMTKHSGQ